MHAESYRKATRHSEYVQASVIDYFASCTNFTNTKPQAMANKAIESEVEYTQGGQPTKYVSRFTRWYRSPLFNIVVVGLISFTQPGIWNALNSTN